MSQIEKLSKAKARILVKQMFFATVLLSTKLVESTHNDTAWTDGKQIGYSKEFFAKLNIEQTVFVLLHEILHIVLMHALRRGHRNALVWNYACDYAINLMLVKLGLEMPTDNDGKPLGLLDRKYDGMGAEQIYELLKQDIQKRAKQGGVGDPNNPSKGDMVVVFGDPGMLGEDLFEPQNIDPETRAEIEREVTQKVAQAANMARLAGKMPGELERIVGELLDPQVPWQQRLAEYALRVTHDNENWNYRNRRYSMYLPARRDVRLGCVGIIGDTSGSIGSAELKTMASEIAAVFDQCRPEVLHVLWADTRVAGRQEFRDGDVFNPDPKGGGGTDMRVPLAEMTGLNPDVAILMTDGHTPWPDVEPDYPLIVLCTTNADVPIGQVIRVK